MNANLEKYEKLALLDILKIGFSHEFFAVSINLVDNNLVDLIVNSMERTNTIKRNTINIVPSSVLR